MEPTLDENQARQGDDRFGCGLVICAIQVDQILALSSKAFKVKGFTSCNLIAMIFIRD